MFFNMRLKPCLLTLFFACARAGNICAAFDNTIKEIDFRYLRVFAAGSPCTEGRKMETNIPMTDLCDALPIGVQLCGQNGNLVKIDHGPTTPFDKCQMGLEIDGEIYEGEKYEYNPGTGGDGQGGPCDADCGLTTIVDGFMQFVGVPMCG